MDHLIAHLERTRSAFDQPTLALLNRHYAPTVLTILAQVFPPHRASVDAEQVALEVEQHRLALAHHNCDDLDGHSVRQLLSRWVREKWLIRHLADDGTELFTLTSHTKDALDFVHRASGAHPLVSSTRMRTLIDTLDRFAHEAQPDRDQRIARIDHDIAQLSRERDELAAGAPMPTMSVQRMVENLDNVRHLVRELPADFARVAESMKDLQRHILTQLRAGDRRAGDVLDDYLDQAQHLLTATPEGRAFTGALDILRDDTTVAALNHAIHTIVSSPAGQSLPFAEKEALRSIVSSIVDSVDVVLSEQQRASRSLTTHLRHYNPAHDREIDDALEHALSALTRWFPSTSRGERVPALPRFRRAHIGKLRTTVPDIRPAQGPPALVDDGEVAAELDRGYARAMGGPHHKDIRQVLEAAPRHGYTTLAQVFQHAPTELQRPVDVLGFQEIMMNDAAPDLDEDHLATTQRQSSKDTAPPADHGKTVREEHLPWDTVTAVRPDGTTRTFLVPRMALPTASQPTEGGTQ